MPLPAYSAYPAVWIEKTKSSHGHGGAGWEFGSCLWSPTADKIGKQIYQNMARVNPGDLIIHFYEDTPFGKEEDYYFCGLSIAAEVATIVSIEPPMPGDWAGRPAYFRIPLKSFAALESPIPISDLIARHMPALKAILETPGDYPLIIYQGGVRLAQGKYLSRCNEALFEIFSREVEETISPLVELSETLEAEKTTKPFDYEAYIEGQRSRREVNYFVRNPRLVRDAKAKYGLNCQCCGFSFSERYPSLGDDFVEVHHLDPLSERIASENSARLLTLDRVAVLCSNCHRMVHRLIRQKRRSVDISELKLYLKS